MGRRKIEPMSEGKKNIIGMLLEEYDIRSAKDIEDALKDLMGGTIQEMWSPKWMIILATGHTSVLTILIIETERKQRKYAEISEKQK